MTGSKTPSAEPVRKAVVVTHGRPEAIGEALQQLEQVARANDVELVFPADEAEKHERPGDGDPAQADMVVVLGGDGTMLRALQRTLGTGTPVIGVNFGDVGFLTSISAQDLEHGLQRVFAGEYVVVELPTIDAEVGGERHAAVNDVVVASSIVGRMVELGWGVGGGGPRRAAVRRRHLLDSLGIDRLQPLERRPGPRVGPRRASASLSSRRTRCTHARSWFRGDGPSRSRIKTVDVPAQVLVDGRPIAELGEGDRVVSRLGEQWTLLAHLPESTFFRRYRETFAS